MYYLKIFLVSIIFLISGCGTTWDILAAENYGSNLQLSSREENINHLKLMIDNPEISYETKLMAHYSLASLHIGQIAPAFRYTTDGRYVEPAVYIDEDQRVGFNVIYLDNKHFPDKRNMAEAKYHLDIVASGLDNVKDSGFESREAILKKFAYAPFYLGEIEKYTGNFESALSYYDQFKKQTFLTWHGKRKADKEISSVNIKIAEENAARQKVINDKKEADLRAKREVEEIEQRKREAEIAKKNAQKPKVSNKRYIFDLESKYKNLIKYSDEKSYKIVNSYDIDCKSNDGRYLPLVNVLLARLNSMNRKDMWLEAYIESRDNEVRIFDVLMSANGVVTEPTLSFEINKWGELRPISIRAEAVSNACYGSYGPIWLVN